MSYLYEAMWVPHLMETGEEKWVFYNGFDKEIPSDEALSTLKVILFPGSVQSTYETTLEWMPTLENLIRKVYTDFPSIKFVGGCYGHQLIA
jgi:GMP synthase-like glutamine amidotransferase